MKILNNIVRKHFPKTWREGLYNFVHDKLVVNYFQTLFPQNALLSYITPPFTSNSQNSTHNNDFEAKIIAKLLSAMDYNVDIINFTSTKNIDFDKYDVIFGFGEPLINSFRRRTGKIITIYYSTGSSILSQNPRSLNRIEECYQQTGQWFLDSGRVVEKAWSVQTSLSDAIICLGTEFIGKTYRPLSEKPIYSIPAFFVKVLNYNDIIEKKDYSEAGKHFLWFGSTGFIHKGLDLLLDIFTSEPDLHLHVCGPLYHDPKFEKYFYKQLYKTKNIHCYGFIDIHSDKFDDLLTKCAFTILPSCSEGCATSVLNVMGNSGAIPIITPYCGLEPMDFAFEIDKIDKQTIKQIINKAVLLSPEELKTRSMKCGEFTNKNYSIENYESLLGNKINKIFADNKDKR